MVLKFLLVFISTANVLLPASQVVAFKGHQQKYPITELPHLTLMKMKEIFAP